jgi:anti-sigma regulatory factor (Ser/Thr protein kinase)
MVETARTLRIDADLAELAGVRRFIRETAAGAGAAVECLEDLVQAVDEAATNVITHGYEGAPGWLDVSATTDGKDLIIRIEDVAPEYDPTTRPEPDLTVPPLHRRPGGMGVHLIREATDAMSYRPRPGGGNILTLVRSMRPRQKEAG